jgi:hypothetical protein
MLSSMNTSMKEKKYTSLSLQSNPNQTKRTTIMTQVTKNNIVELSADDLNVVTGGKAIDPNKYGMIQPSEDGKYQVLYNETDPKKLEVFNSQAEKNRKAGLNDWTSRPARLATPCENAARGYV